MMRFLHAMVRIRDLDSSLAFFRDALGLVVIRRVDVEAGRFSLIYLAASMDENQAKDAAAPQVELTYNWDAEDYKGGRNFGHLAYEVDDIYATCERLMSHGVTINRPPRDGRMAFVRSPDGISIELLQKKPALPSAEPWSSMENIGSW